MQHVACIENLGSRITTRCQQSDRWNYCLVCFQCLMLGDISGGFVFE